MWSGKGEVLKATVEVAIPWIQVEGRLLGDIVTKPINYGSSSSLDLFLGDKYFEKREDGDDGAMDESDNGGGGDISEQVETPMVLITGLCRLFLVQSFPSAGALRSITDVEVLPFRSDVMQALETLLKTLPNNESELRQTVFSFCAPRLLRVFGDLSSKEPPLIVSKSIACFAASLWSSPCGKGQDDILDYSNLLTIFSHHVDYSKQSAWTVRAAAAECTARVAQCVTVSALRQHQCVSAMLDNSSLAMKTGNSGRSGPRITYTAITCLARSQKI